MDGALHVVGHEADQEGQQNNHNHSNDSVAGALLPSESAVARQQAPDYTCVTQQNDQEGKSKTQNHRQIVEHQQLPQPLTPRRLKALGFIGAAVDVLAVHEEWRGRKADEEPDAHAHEASAPHRHQLHVLQREDDGQEPGDGHGRQEVNAAVEVDVKGVGAHAAHKVPVIPLALVDVVEDAQRQHRDAQQVGHGQVGHVDVKRRALATAPGQHHQDQAVPNQAKDGDKGVGGGVNLVTEAIDGRAERRVVLAGVCGIGVRHRTPHVL